MPQNDGGAGAGVERAYDECAAITRREAKNFAYGIALLPPPKRRAMSVVYALARRVDDIADDPGDPVARAHALATLRHQVHHVIATATEPPDPSRRDRGRVGRPAASHPTPPGGDPAGSASPVARAIPGGAGAGGAGAGGAGAGDPVLVALGDVVGRYPLPLDAVGDLFDGCGRDLAEDGSGFATYDELVGYCRQVAGSIGRLSLAIFGTDDPAVTSPLADDLGVALQLTNILRDVVEDRDQLGRTYLPAEDLARFGCAPDASGPADRLAALVTFEAERARGWYDSGLRLLPHLDRRSRACVAAMAGIYHRLLDRIERDPAAALHGRVSLPTTEKLAVAARSLTPWPDRHR